MAGACINFHKYISRNEQAAVFFHKLDVSRIWMINLNKHPNVKHTKRQATQKNNSGRNAGGIPHLA